MDSITPGETRSDAVALLRRYLKRRPVTGGLLHVALEVARDGTVMRMASRWDDLPEDIGYLPWRTWDELV